MFLRCHHFYFYFSLRGCLELFPNFVFEFQIFAFPFYLSNKREFKTVHKKCAVEGS